MLDNYLSVDRPHLVVKISTRIQKISETRFRIACIAWLDALYSGAKPTIVMKGYAKHAATVAFVLTVMACETQEVSTTSQAADDTPIFMEFPGASGNPTARVSGNQIKVLSAEYLTAAESGRIGRTVYFTDMGNQMLDSDFVPLVSLDSTDDISFYIDETRPTADLAVGVSSAAIARAMNTWNSVICSDLGVYRVPSNPSTKAGFVSSVLGFGGSEEYFADVVHAGWLPGAFFNLFDPQGSTFILAVTFTLIFTDDEGNPTDLDSNGKADVAFREIYYNDTFRWRIGATVDVETVALHESGHALSQDHFGQAFADPGSGQIHFSPRAVMNAAYSGVQTTIGQSDLAGHCSIWASWNVN